MKQRFFNFASPCMHNHDKIRSVQMIFFLHYKSLVRDFFH